MNYNFQEGHEAAAEDPFAGLGSAPPISSSSVTSPGGGYSIPAAPTEIPIAPLVMPAAPFAMSSSPVVVKATNIMPPSAGAPVYGTPYTPINNISPAPVPAPIAAAPRPTFSPARSGAPLTAADPRAKDAMELCAFAMAALKHNDIALARERLQLALQRLG